MSEDKEIGAMSAIAKALDDFSDDESDIRERILQWASARYRLKNPATSGNQRKKETEESGGGRTSEFESFADLYHAAEPDTDIDRVLVAGYWLGQAATRAEFTGMDTNKELKNLGHPIGHISNAFQSLIDRRPALVMQTAKSGSSQQARKKYKLTNAGIAAVQSMTRNKE
jgi:hypothetical protein